MYAPEIYNEVVKEEMSRGGETLRQGDTLLPFADEDTTTCCFRVKKYLQVSTK